MALATLVAVLTLTEPLGGHGTGSRPIVITGENPAGAPLAQAAAGPETAPGWRVSLRPGSTVDLDTGVVVERSDTLALGADLVFDTGLRLVSAIGDEVGGLRTRLEVLSDPSTWPKACAPPQRLQEGHLADYVDTRRLRRGSALCARTTGGRLLLLTVDTAPTASKPVLALELRRSS